MADIRIPEGEAGQGAKDAINKIYGALKQQQAQNQGQEGGQNQQQGQSGQSGQGQQQGQQGQGQQGQGSDDPRLKKPNVDNEQNNQNANSSNQQQGQQSDSNEDEAGQSSSNNSQSQQQQSQENSQGQGQGKSSEAGDDQTDSDSQNGENGQNSAANKNGAQQNNQDVKHDQRTGNGAKATRIGDYNQNDVNAAKEARDRARGEDPNIGSGKADFNSEGDLVKNAKEVADKAKRDADTERREMKAQKDEIKRWDRDPMRQFKASVEEFLADDRVTRHRDDWSRPNTRRDYGDERIPNPARKNFRTQGYPEVNVYFDQANSKSQHATDIGEMALSTLRPFEEKGMLKINLFYYAKQVHNQDRATLNRETAYSWTDSAGNIIDTAEVVNSDNLIEHIRKTGADNVVILTDHKMHPTKRIKIPGAVWLFFYQGSYSSEFDRAIIGETLKDKWIIS